MTPREERLGTSGGDGGTSGSASLDRAIVEAGKHSDRDTGFVGSGGGKNQKRRGSDREKGRNLSIKIFRRTKEGGKNYQQKGGEISLNFLAVNEGERTAEGLSHRTK